MYNFEVKDSTAYLIMEYVEGTTLERFLREHDGDLTLDVVAHIFSSIAHALEFAHSHNVLHLDIKPANVLINRQGEVKVTDFGLATLAELTARGPVRAAARSATCRPSRCAPRRSTSAAMNGHLRA